jgi:4-coumarate--CoA ligase
MELSNKNVIAKLDPGYKEKVSRSGWLCLLLRYHEMGQNKVIDIAITRGIPVHLPREYEFVKFLRMIEQFRITDLTLVSPIAIRWLSIIKRGDMIYQTSKPSYVVLHHWEKKRDI